MTVSLLDAPALCPGCGDEIDPAGDLDHVAIDRALAGDQTAKYQLTKAERYEAIRVGVRRGLTLNEAALRIGLNGHERQLAIRGVRPAPAPRSRRGGARR